MADTVRTTTIEYSTTRQITADQFIEVLQESTLAERRPVDSRPVIESMLQHANLLVTAWDGGKLVGVARSLSDFGFVTYCSDLAVHAGYQKLGIGRELLRLTLEKGGCRIVLLAAPKAVDYYPRIGFTKHNSAWMVQPGEL